MAIIPSFARPVRAPTAMRRRLRPLAAALALSQFGNNVIGAASDQNFSVRSAGIGPDIGAVEFDGLFHGGFD